MHDPTRVFEAFYRELEKQAQGPRFVGSSGVDWHAYDAIVAREKAEKDKWDHRQPPGYTPPPPVKSPQSQLLDDQFDKTHAKNKAQWEAEHAAVADRAAASHAPPGSGSAAAGALRGPAGNGKKIRGGKLPVGKTLAGAAAVAGTAALGHHLWKKHKEKRGSSIKAAIDFHGIAGNAAAMGGIGAMTGAAGGALYGGVQGYRKARSEGGGVASGFAGGLGGVITGGGKGALLGGAAGGLVGAVDPRAVASSLARRDGPIGAGARFGQRQLHGLTGWRPTQGSKELQSIRGGSYDAVQGANKARDSLSLAQRGGDLKEIGKAQKAVDKAGVVRYAAEKAEGMGLTNIPGYARSLVDKPAATLRAAAAEQWHGGGKVMKGITVGLPALGAVSALGAKEGPTGPGKGEHVGRELGSSIGTIAGTPLPIVGNLAVGEAFGRAGGYIGKGVDRLRGRHPDLKDLGRHPGLKAVGGVQPAPVGGVQPAPTNFAMEPRHALRASVMSRDLQT